MTKISGLTHKSRDRMNNNYRIPQQSTIANEANNANTFIALRDFCRIKQVITARKVVDSERLYRSIAV